ncbi:MAG: hypothetical protein ACOC9B_04995 [Chloroflexota bacterium]
MKPLKAEIRAVADALDREYDDVMAAAEAAIKALDKIRVEQEPYGLLFVEAETYICVSPFRTISQTERFARKMGLEPEDAVRVLVVHPERY